MVVASGKRTPDSFLGGIRSFFLSKCLASSNVFISQTPFTFKFIIAK